MYSQLVTVPVTAADARGANWRAVVAGAWGVAWRRVRDLGTGGVGTSGERRHLGRGRVPPGAQRAWCATSQRGRTRKIDVCDAHPELLRAARNVGRPTKEPCPICDEGRLVKVTFVFGAKLPPGGRCPGTAAELNRLRRRAEPVLCYEVEVCPDCAWHHLMRKYPAGGPQGASRRRAAQ